MIIQKDRGIHCVTHGFSQTGAGQRLQQSGPAGRDPAAASPSVQVVMRDCNCKVIKTTELLKIIAAASSARHGVVTEHSNKTQR